MGDNPVFGILLILLAFAVFAVATAIMRRWRSDKMSQVAKKLSLRFDADKNRRLPRKYDFLDKLSSGRDRHVRNVLRGEYRGHSVTAFDFYYTAGSGKHKRQYSLSFFILDLQIEFPELTIAREGLISKLVQALGHDDIDFESHEFSSKYVVRSRRKKFAYDFCNAKMIDYLLDEPIVSIEVERSSLAVAYDSLLDPEEIELHMNRLLRIRELMPNYLFDR